MSLKSFKRGTLNAGTVGCTPYGNGDLGRAGRGSSCVVSSDTFRNGGTTCCALNYGLGFSRASAFNGVLRSVNIVATRGKRGTSVYLVGAYSIARITSRGYHRTVRHVIQRGPNTFIVIANYCTRLRSRGIDGVRNISLILNTGRGTRLVRCLDST